MGRAIRRSPMNMASRSSRSLARATCCRRDSPRRCSTAPTSPSSSRRRSTRRQTCSAAWRPVVRWCAAPPDGTNARPSLEALARATHGALLWTPTSRLVYTCSHDRTHRGRRLVKDRTEVRRHLVDTHHRLRTDAPSGTGLALADRAARGRRPRVPITSIRVGSRPRHARDSSSTGRFERLPAGTRRARPARVRGGSTRRGQVAGGTGTGVFTLDDMLSGAPHDSRYAGWLFHRTRDAVRCGWRR